MFDRAQFAHSPVAHEFTRRDPLWMEAIHEGFHHDQTWMIRRCVNQATSIGGVETERLLAQYVLARLERRDRPVDMEVVRQGVVNCLDARISEQVVVRPVCDRHPALIGPCGRPSEIPRSDCDDVMTPAACSGGTTCLAAIAAVERIPQRRGGSIVVSVIALTLRRADRRRIVAV